MPLAIYITNLVITLRTLLLISLILLCMNCFSGTVTDGEFCSLRSRGETRALHLWQLIHDARESAQKFSKKTLLEMLILIDS